MAVRDGEGSLVAEGALATTTGPHTGRSPKDRFIVDRPGIHASIDWGAVNQPIDASRLDRLWAKARAHVGGRDLYVQDLLAGADPSLSPARARDHGDGVAQPVRAQHVPGPDGDARQGFEPDFTVVQLPSLRAEPALWTAPARRPRSWSISSVARC